jgi:Cu/Zn superoxide dismutase
MQAISPKKLTYLRKIGLIWQLTTIIYLTRSKIMTKTIKVTSFMFVAMMLAIFSVSVASAEAITVTLYDVQYRNVGTAVMTPLEDGTTEITVKVSGMENAGGDRALAIAEVGYCSPEGDFSTAGDTTQALPNVQFFASGSADSKFTVSDVDLTAIADADGASLVIYADAGETPGARIICGVIAAGPAPEAPAEETPAEETPAEAATPEAATPETTAPAAETPVAATPEATTPEATDTERTLEDALNEGYGAILRDVQGRDVGLALMLETNDGMAGVTFYLEGMEAGSGDHRVAIAGTDVCEAPEFTSAGDEVATLPNVQFYSSGSADYGKLIEDLDLDTLADADGSSLVIYADAGETPGARIICGSVTSAADTLGYYGVSVEDFADFVVLLALES